MFSSQTVFNNPWWFTLIYVFRFCIFASFYSSCVQSASLSFKFERSLHGHLFSGLSVQILKFSLCPLNHCGNILIKYNCTINLSILVLIQFNFETVIVLSLASYYISLFGLSIFFIAFVFPILHFHNTQHFHTATLYANIFFKNIFMVFAKVCSGLFFFHRALCHPWTWGG